MMAGGSDEKKNSLSFRRDRPKCQAYVAIDVVLSINEGSAGAIAVAYGEEE